MVVLSLVLVVVVPNAQPGPPLLPILVTLVLVLVAETADDGPAGPPPDLKVEE